MEYDEAAEILARIKRIQKKLSELRRKVNDLWLEKE